ncbi:hypothetical protein CDCA_CDCA12G3536 [Cyanidium caldarium]|uniref:BRO1 domain-containing protein n=1 Tax=Cyanidium caldarium TaxID=2771 RepID=A0AAV9IZF9_CYACA|nr:hypothetical protein CDCA_CDCA12G3536 [Cyanidium caldarium]
MGNILECCGANSATGQGDAIPADLVTYQPSLKRTKAVTIPSQEDANALRESYVQPTVATPEEQETLYVKRLTRTAIAPYLCHLAAMSYLDVPAFAWSSALAPESFTERQEVPFESVNVIYLLTQATAQRAVQVKEHDWISSTEAVSVGAGELPELAAATGEPREDRRSAAYRLYVEAIEDLEAARALRDEHFTSAQALRLPTDLTDAVIEALIHQFEGQAEEIAVAKALAARPLSVKTRSASAASSSTATTNAATGSADAPAVTAKTLAMLAHSSVRHFQDALSLLDQVCPQDRQVRIHVQQERYHAWIEYLRFKVQVVTARARCLQAIDMWQTSSLQEDARGAALAAFQSSFDALEAARSHVHKSWCGASRTQREQVLQAVAILETEIMEAHAPAGEENMRLYLTEKHEHPPPLPAPRGLLRDVQAWDWRSASAEPTAG